jgi:hypothetical protein
MANDDRIRALATEFAGNWLDFRRFEEHNAVDRERFKTFNDDLRRAMFEEPVRFVVDAVRSDRSVLDFVYGHHTFVNPVLAKHYGMEDVNRSADTWQRIDICPLQLNDDSLATLETPADDWPGFEATQSIPDEECPASPSKSISGTAFAPIELHRWDGESVPLGPLNTPVTGFDGQREWAIFRRRRPALHAEEATAGAPCATPPW